MAPRFVELDPAEVRRLLAGHPDELSGEKLKMDAYYRQHQCPRCGGKCDRAFLGEHHAFAKDSGWLLPRSGLKCCLCDCVFDPHSGVIVSLGNVGKIKERMDVERTPDIQGND